MAVYPNGRSSRASARLKSNSRACSIAGPRTRPNPSPPRFFLRICQDQEPGGTDSLAVPQGRQHGRLQRSASTLVGPSAAGLSATTITRLKAVWEDEFAEWTKRSLEGAVRVPVGRRRALQHPPGGRSPVILVLMGATEDGRKELIAVADGYRESEQSWKALLLDVKARGLVVDPKLAIGDVALGFWKALPQVYPATRQQRCWVHKTAKYLRQELEICAFDLRKRSPLIIESIDPESRQ